MIDYGDQARGRKHGAKCAAVSADVRHNVKSSIVPQQNVLGDGQAETRSTGFARATLVYAIKTLGEPHQVFGRNADTGVLDLEAPLAAALVPAQSNVATLGV